MSLHLSHYRNWGELSSCFLHSPLIKPNLFLSNRVRRILLLQDRYPIPSKGTGTIIVPRLSEGRMYNGLLESTYPLPFPLPIDLSRCSIAIWIDRNNQIDWIWENSSSKPTIMG